MVKCLKSCES